VGRREGQGERERSGEWKGKAMGEWEVEAAGGCVCVKNYYQPILLIYLPMAFDPKDYASPFVTVEEVLDIKKGFDLFDRDLGGAIDPKGTPLLMQNSRWRSTRWALRPRLRRSTR
jgi:hypothetical protein